MWLFYKLKSSGVYHKSTKYFYKITIIVNFYQYLLIISNDIPCYSNTIIIIFPKSTFIIVHHIKQYHIITIPFNIQPNYCQTTFTKSLYICIRIYQISKRKEKNVISFGNVTKCHTRSAFHWDVKHCRCCFLSYKGGWIRFFVDEHVGHSLYRATVKERTSRDCHDIRACFDALIIDKKRIMSPLELSWMGDRWGKIQYIWYNQYETTFHEISIEWPSAEIFLRRMKRKRRLLVWIENLGRVRCSKLAVIWWTKLNGYEPGSWGWYYVSWYFQFSIPEYIFRDVIFLHVIRWIIFCKMISCLFKTVFLVIHRLYDHYLTKNFVWLDIVSFI